MLTVKTPALTPITWCDGGVPSDVRVAALGDRTALLVTPGELLIVQLDGTEARTLRAIQYPCTPTQAALSLSAKFALVAGPERLRVWEQTNDAPIIEIAAEEPRTSVVAAFARLADREVLVCSPRKKALRAYDLPGGELLFAGTMHTFQAELLVPSADGSHLAALGYFYAETKDSLAVIPMTELTAPDDVLNSRFQKKLPIADYAYRLAAGPCGADAFIFFRDPEDDEDPDADDEEPVVDTTGTGLAIADVKRHCSFYVRAFDGTLRTRRAWNAPLESFARLAASPSWIAAETGDQITLVPFDASRTSSVIDARWLAASPDGSRVLVEPRGGGLAVLTIPGQA